MDKQSNNSAEDILQLIRTNKAKPRTEEQIQAAREKERLEHPYSQLDLLEQGLEKLKDSELWQSYDSIGKIPRNMIEFLKKG